MIRLIDPADDATMRQVFDVGVAAKSVGRPWFSPPTFDSWLIGLRMPDPEETQELYGAFDDAGECVGTSLLFIPQHDNLDKIYADIDVTPDRRRRGIGRDIVRHALARVRASGRSTLLVETLEPAGDVDHGYADFARAVGFRPAWHEITRHLALPVDGLKLTELAAAAGGRRDGYRIETFVGPVPGRFLPTLSTLMSMVLVDAPSGEVDFDPEEFGPDRLRRMYAREEAQGRIRLSALAIDESSGDVVAETELILDRSHDPVVQEGTYVHREHRGHRLGMAVKVANLQRLQRDYPGRPFVRTMNADTNEHMISINRTLGFEVVETMTSWSAGVGGR